MAERAGLFEDDAAGDFDVSAFKPKMGGTPPAPKAEAIREVSEGAQFQSREPVKSAPKPAKKLQRRKRTGRNLQLNLKVAANTHELFYQISDRQGWVLGETLERALAALQRELTAKT